MRVRKIEQEKVFMNTIIHITLFSDKPTVYTQQKIQEAFSCFDRVVKKYTRFSPKSELSALNNSGGKPMKVSDEFYYLIEYMLELGKITDGNYDPTIIDILETYGYGANRNFKELDDPNLYENIQTLVEKRPSPSQIKLNKKNKTVQFAPRQ
ncbi:MAG TPA: FAD:protein FMN transferase, partial [Candidatus Dojkabacteria bacterium]|nr:FAD:protein FMN transferase [Candidatus Dojkabacteria bacterium]